ncbi:hypothetical protein N9K47_00400 [bacterium]|nr:hypothetical protein [bacterium]
MAVYNAVVDGYRQDGYKQQTGTSPSRPATGAPLREVKLVECNDGAMRPSVGLCFAFVAAPEKLDLILKSSSDAEHSGDAIVQRRRRTSAELNLERLMPMDSLATFKLECEVQKIVAQTRAPPPKKMWKRIKQ